jgi:5-methylcytosine-specific restriction endonuclease McrA
MAMRNKQGQFIKGHHWRSPQLFREKDWLFNAYITQQQSTGEISKQFGVTDAAIIFWLKKHNIKRRSVSEARSIKHWGLSGPDNPMWNKRGELNHNWKGGVTPERQEFYTSTSWKKACHAVWRRDRATCQRCEAKKKDYPDMPFHIHHIQPFSDRELRADVGNLTLLCESCHQFVHSKRNVNREHLPKI